MAEKDDGGQGFGKKVDKRGKSSAQYKREGASDRYDDIAATGGQEYSIFVRQFGGEANSWLPCGSVAVQRGEQVSDTIYGNEKELKTAIVRTYPKLRGDEDEFEYGYNLKLFADDPVEVAMKSGGKKKSSDFSIGGWVSNLLSPVDTSNVKKD